MSFTRLLLVITVVALAPAYAAGAQWPEPASPVVPEADGYVVIPNVAKAPTKTRVYRAVWDATQGADAPNHIIPALNMAGSELNALGASGMPVRNARFVVVFHGDAMDGILDDAHYRAKFGVANPNLSVLTAMKKAGVELYVCGQNMAFANVDPATITPLVTVASDALLVLMEYQNSGYALMSF
jgi:intracellular sulfur oxidation DsrE/DsrF family protein